MGQSRCPNATPSEQCAIIVGLSEVRRRRGGGARSTILEGDKRASGWEGNK